MLMWLTGFLVVPLFQQWSGLPFLCIATGLLALWLCAYGPLPIAVERRRSLQRWVEGLAAEEAVVGGITGPLAGVHLAWNFTLGYVLPWWAPWTALGAGLGLLALSRAREIPAEWLLPVRGRWRRLTLAALGMTNLHLAGPCWIFLLELWRFEWLGAGGPPMLAARAASLLLTAVAALYTVTFLLRFVRRSEEDTAAESGPSLSPQAS